MDCDSLIDFNSPLRKDRNMLDPLVPLPKYLTDNANGNIEAVGDNPFDNAILQLCKFDDPFEVTEKQAFEHKEEDNKLPDKPDVTENLPSNVKTKCDMKQTDCAQKVSTPKKCDKSPLKLKLDEVNTSYDAFNIGQYASLKSLQELSPVVNRIESNFSKLYLSAQFDKQLLDESSKCMDSGVQDSSITGNSGIDVFNQSEKCPSPMDIPRGPAEVKAFVASRIERCIEKALNDSRRTHNCSFGHRRSLSATSLCAGTMLHTENPYNYSSLKPSFDPIIAAKYKNRSFSTHDLHSSLTSNMWGNQRDVLDVRTVDTLANTSSRFNIGFRKSTATSSMYSSYAAVDTGFRKRTTSLTNLLRPSNSSFVNSPEVEVGDDSVFMEAKNLSCILKRRANAKDDEPLEDDFNFLSESNFQIELIDTDSSYSGDDDVENSSQHETVKQTSAGKGCKKTGSKTKNAQPGETGKKDVSPSTGEAPIPLSRDKVSGLELRSSGFNPKKFRNPLIGPVPTAANSENLVLKLKSKTESKVLKRGPMKAMIPVGNMMRHEAKKENTAPSKPGVGLQLKGVAKSVSSNNSVRKSAANNLLKSKISPSTIEASSPAVCGRPVACSTPSVDGALPLASPPLSLQMSQISSGSPVGTGLHKRSKSAGCTAAKDLESEPQLTTTPTRKVPGHIRSKSGLTQSKQSPDAISPGQERVITSTPLKAIPKNSPSLNRLKKSIPANKKLLPRESNSRLEKENRQPTVEKKRQPLWRSSRRVEA